MTMTLERLYELRETVVSANDAWFRALDSEMTGKDERAVYNDTLAAYRSAEAQAINERLRETCWRCGGEGVVNYGRVVLTLHRRDGSTVNDRFCFACAGAKTLLVRKHRFEAQAPTLLKRANKARAQVTAETKARTEKWDRFAAEHAKVAAYLAPHRGDKSYDDENDDYFLRSLASAVERFGGLSEKQMAAVERQMERQVAEQARQEQVAKHSFPSSGDTVEGEIVKLIPSRGYGGGTVYRALILLTTGHKVMGTASERFYDGADKLGTTVENLRVRFSANFEQRDDDFGFYKSPKKVEVLGTREAVTA